MSAEHEDLGSGLRRPMPHEVRELDEQRGQEAMEAFAEEERQKKRRRRNSASSSVREANSVALSGNAEDPGCGEVRSCDSQRIVQALGTSDPRLTFGLLQALDEITSGEKHGAAHLKFALAALCDIGPKDSVERLLVVQMVATHHAAIMFLKKATMGESPETIQSNAIIANEFMKTFARQTEALNDHRRPQE